MTFQPNLGTSLLHEREHARVTLALLSSPPSALSPASAWQWWVLDSIGRKAVESIPSWWFLGLVRAVHQCTAAKAIVVVRTLSVGNLAIPPAAFASSFFRRCLHKLRLHYNALPLHVSLQSSMTGPGGQMARSCDFKAHLCIYIYTAVYSQTLTAISIFKYDNIVCIIQVHTSK